MRKAGCVGLLWVCLAGSVAFADEAGELDVFQGKVGNADVMLSLEKAGGRYVRGRYFYTRYGGELDLWIKNPGPDWPADEREPAVDDKEGHLTGIWRGAWRGDRLEGTWSPPGAAGGKNFALHRVGRQLPEDRLEGAPVTAASPYTFARLSALFTPRTVGKETPWASAIVFRNIKDEYSGTVFPRLVRHPDAETLKRANDWLLAVHLGRVLSAEQTLEALREVKDLESGAAVAKKLKIRDALFGQWAKLSYVGPAWLSVIESGVTDGGGAHPNAYFEAYTFDLKADRRLEPPHSADGKGYMFGFLDTRGKQPAFDALWQGRLRTQLRRAGVGKEDEGEASCNVLENEPDYALYLLPEGLAVRPLGSSNLAEGCIAKSKHFPLVIPYAELEPFLAAGQAPPNAGDKSRPTAGSGMP